MRPQLPENALVSLLRQCYTTPRCQGRPYRFHSSRPRIQHSNPASFAQQRRGYQKHNEGSGDGNENLVQFAAPSNPSPGSQPRHNIAILGGGITGLSAAHYLTRELPAAKITIYEGGRRLGGWLKSKSVDVGNGNVVFESGPRTLRPNTPAGLVTLEMIEKLGLQDELLVTSRFSDAARNRFIYYPDHLVKMPGPGQDFYSMAWNILTEPAFKGFLFGAIMEWNKPQRSTWAQYDNPEIDDESVGSFLQRRFGSPDPGNNLVSAVLHGIYAGDINQLSARSLLPKLWYHEAIHGSVVKANSINLKERTATEDYSDAMLRREMHAMISQPTREVMGNASVYTFKEGIETLSNALEKSLRTNPNVQINMEEEVQGLELDPQANCISIKTSNNDPSLKHTNVISTLYGGLLSSIASIPSLAGMHAVTVMVVNLYFPDPNILPERGFGYLIPRSIPFEQNPECALGVVFDSDATVGQDDIPGTKVTVMLGGHWWDGMDIYPDEEEGAHMARAILHRHLNVDAKPTKVNVSLQSNCIPQYVVGHEARMKKSHGELMQEFKGKLHVAGNSYTGVGLNDCVRAARDVVMRIKNEDEFTGLEKFTAPAKWATARF